MNQIELQFTSNYPTLIIHKSDIFMRNTFVKKCQPLKHNSNNYKHYIIGGLGDYKGLVF